MGAKLLQWCLTLCNSVDCSLLGSTVHGILQARILELVSMLSSGGSLDPGIKPASPVASALKADSLLLRHWGSPVRIIAKCINQSRLGLIEAHFLHSTYNMPGAGGYAENNGQEVHSPGAGFRIVSRALCFVLSKDIY